MDTFISGLAIAWPTLAFIATLTPTPKDDGFLFVLKKGLDLIAFNWGKAKNKD